MANNDNKNANKQELNINLPEEVAKGNYCNLAIIVHSPTEFVMDYVSVLPGVQQGVVQSRVIMAPIHAKRLLKALQENISIYENQNGEIQDGQAPNVQFPLNFNGTAGEA